MQLCITRRLMDGLGTHLFSHNSGGWKSELRVTVWPDSHEGPLLACTQLPCYMWAEKDRSLISLPLVIKTPVLLA